MSQMTILCIFDNLFTLGFILIIFSNGDVCEKHIRRNMFI